MGKSGGSSGDEGGEGVMAASKDRGGRFRESQNQSKLTIPTNETGRKGS